MKQFIKPLLFVFALLSTTTIISQSKEIKLNLSKGDIFEFNTEMNTNIHQDMMGMKMNLSQKYNVKLTVEVKDVLPNGDYLINQSYKRVVVEANTNGQTLNYDTNNSDTSSPLASIGNLKDAVVSYNLSPKGKVSKVKGLTEIGDLVGNNPQIKNMLKGIANEKLLESTFLYIPEKKVDAGANYSKTVVLEEFVDTKLVTKYTIESIDASSIHLSMSSRFDISPDKPIVQNGMKMNMKGEGTQTGTLEVFRSSGMPKANDTKQKIEMTITMKNPQTDEDITIPMKIETNVKTQVKKL